MSNIDFMKNKYTLDELVGHFLEDIKLLRPMIKQPSDEHQLQTYYQAVNVFKGVSTKDIVAFALSFGRSQGVKAEQMRNAFPTLLCNRVMRPSAIDAAYAKLLLTYVIGFRDYRQNLKEWMLRFVISSRFSPLTGLVDREINHVIEETKRKITSFVSYR